MYFILLLYSGSSIPVHIALSMESSPSLCQCMPWEWLSKRAIYDYSLVKATRTLSSSLQLSHIRRAKVIVSSCRAFCIISSISVTVKILNGLVKILNTLYIHTEAQLYPLNTASTGSEYSQVLFLNILSIQL